MRRKKFPLGHVDLFELYEDVGVSCRIDVTLESSEGNFPNAHNCLISPLGLVGDAYEQASPSLIREADGVID